LLQVDVCSRHSAVRLDLDGARIGEKPTDEAHEFMASFAVPYTPGRLRVVGLRDGNEIEELELQTAAEAARIRLSPDRLRIRADGQDLSFVAVDVVDRQGRLRPDASLPVRFVIKGPGTIAGIGSGDLTTRESFQANPRRVFQGRALVVVRSTAQAGAIQLRAEAAGLDGSSVTLESGP
jgi:beta-galactosidase